MTRQDLAQNQIALKLSQGGYSNEEIDNNLASESQSCYSQLAPRSAHMIDKYVFPIAKGNVNLVGLLIAKGASVTGRLEGYTPTELAKKYSQGAVFNCWFLAAVFLWIGHQPNSHSLKQPGVAM